MVESLWSQPVALAWTAACAQRLLRALTQHSAGSWPGTARRPQRQPCDTKQTYLVLIWRCSSAPCVFLAVFSVYIYGFICALYFKHTQLSLAITVYTTICVALVQRSPWTSDECWRTTDAQKTLQQKLINFQWVGRASTMCYWALRLVKNLKMPALSAHIAPIQLVPNACPANI